jgi:hypothetical protein
VRVIYDREMSSDGAARAAARNLLDSRLATAPDYLVPTLEERSLVPADLRRRVHSKLEWREAARIHLLVAEDVVEHPQPLSDGLPWTGRFFHSLAQHLWVSAKDYSLDLYPDRKAALLLSAYFLQRIVSPAEARRTKRQIDELPIDSNNADWIVSMGVNRVQFEKALNLLNDTHRQKSHAVARPTSLAVAPPSQPAEPERTSPEVPSRTGSMPNSARPGAVVRPAWLVLGPPAAWSSRTSPLAWQRPDEPLETTPSEREAALTEAWSAFSAGDLAATDEALLPIYGSVGHSWGPARGADGVLQWDWLRFVRLAALANDGSYEFRRIAAVSAVDLLTRTEFGLPALSDAARHLVEISMASLQPVAGGNLSRAFATYSGRLVAILGHEQLFAHLAYANDEKARTRAVWALEFPRLDLTKRTTSADAAAAIKKAYREFSYRVSQLLESERLSPRLPSLLRSSLDLLDPDEQSIVGDAREALEEALELVKSTAIDVNTVEDLNATLQNLADRVCVSGSLLLQETLNPALWSAQHALSDSLTRAARVSQPQLVAELDSAKLPLTAKSDRPFAVRFRIRNDGNSPAREIWAQADSEHLEFAGSVRAPAEIPPAGEQELTFHATSAADVHTATTRLRLTWRNDLGQDFETDTIFVAEDQRPSLWSRTDANPYTLSSISEPERLVGRSTESASLEGILRMSDSTYVTGLKRVGKSSLVRTVLTALRNEEDWAVSLMELGTMLGGSRSPASVAIGLIDGITEALEDAGYEVPEFVLPAADHDDYARRAGRWLRSLERSIPALTSLHVVVAVDDFDGIPIEFVEGEGGPGLFLFLRSLVDKKWLSLVLIGSEILPTVISGQGFHLNQVRRTALDHFASKEDTGLLLTRPAGDRLEWSHESIELIHQTVNGNPYYATMIAQRLWDNLRTLDRTLVEPADVTDAVAHVARIQEAFHFSHMWSDDSTGMAPKSRNAMLSAAVLLATALSAPSSSSGADAEEVITVAKGIAGDVTGEELTRIRRRLLARQILATSDGSTNVAVRVPLFAEWLRTRGRSDLETEFEQFSRTAGAKRTIAAGDLVEIAKGLDYAGRRVNEIQLRAWIDQFGDDPRDRHLAFLLLRRMVREGYFSGTAIHRILPRLADQIRAKVPELQTAKGYLTNAILVSHGAIGSSTPATVTSFHQIMRIKKADCVPVNQVPERIERIKNPVLIVVDDFAGTGNQLARTVDALCGELDRFGNWRDSTVLVTGSAIAADTSAWTAQRFGDADLRVAVGRQIDHRLRAFHEDAEIFDSKEDRERAKDLVETIGRSLVSSNPLGWNGQELLVLLGTNCPNNTLPIFWKDGTFQRRPWTPLFPRAM